MNCIMKSEQKEQVYGNVDHTRESANRRPKKVINFGAFNTLEQLVNNERLKTCEQVDLLRKHLMDSEMELRKSLIHNLRLKSLRVKDDTVVYNLRRSPVSPTYLKSNFPIWSPGQTSHRQFRVLIKTKTKIVISFNAYVSTALTCKFFRDFLFHNLHNAPYLNSRFHGKSLNFLFSCPLFLLHAKIQTLIDTLKLGKTVVSEC